MMNVSISRFDFFFLSIFCFPEFLVLRLMKVDGEDDEEVE